MLVIGYLDGRDAATTTSFADPDVAARGPPRRCRRLHAGPALHRRLRHVRAGRRRTSRTVRERGFRLLRRATPTTTTPSSGYGGRSRSAPRPTVPCNNDLLAGNFVDDGDEVWLIDYEYSGNNDACFELGNTAHRVRPRRRPGRGAGRRRTSASPTAAPLARVRLQALVSRVRLVAVGRHPGRRQPPRLRLPRRGGMERFEKAAATLPSSRASSGCWRTSPRATDLPDPGPGRGRRRRRDRHLAWPTT